MTDYLQVVTTVGNEEEALRLAEQLVWQQLAACVQVVGPVTSVYRWQGNVETGQEWQCVIKTRGACYEKLEAAILELHSYDVPELIAMPITVGSAKYLAWIDESTAE